MPPGPPRELDIQVRNAMKNSGEVRMLQGSCSSVNDSTGLLEGYNFAQLGKRKVFNAEDRKLHQKRWARNLVCAAPP